MALPSISLRLLLLSFILPVVKQIGTIPFHLFSVIIMMMTMMIIIIIMMIIAVRKASIIAATFVK